MTYHVFAKLWICLLCMSLMMSDGGTGQESPDIGADQGNLYPNFQLPRLDGSTGNLSDYRGQKIVLFQFASW